MSVYLINYDLRKQRDKNSLQEQIRRYGICHQVFDSSWVIASDKSITQIRDELAKYINRHDRLLVARLHGEAAWRRLEVELSLWLKIQLNSRIG
jgi:hypothetical protein